MRIDVSSNIAALSKTLDDIGKNQIPFAASRAINSAAKLAQASVTTALPSTFDRPTPFTMNAVGVRMSTKRDLTASVFVKDAQAKYLSIEETGGTRLPSGAALLLPVDIKPNQYGNMRKGAIVAALAQPDTFSGVIHGVAGIWKRPKRAKQRRGAYSAKGNNSPVLLVAYERSATYKPRFHFKDQISVSVLKNLPSLLQLRMQEALGTAR